MVSRYEGRSVTISDLIRGECSRANSLGCESERRDCLEYVGELIAIRRDVGDIDEGLVEGYVHTYRLMSDSERLRDF